MFGCDSHLPLTVNQDGRQRGVTKDSQGFSVVVENITGNRMQVTEVGRNYLKLII